MKAMLRWLMYYVSSEYVDRIYFFRKLKPGKYKIEAKAPGFVNAIHTIRVNTAPADANDNDDTYYAETLDIILRRLKGIK